MAKVESLINMDEDRLNTRFDMYFEDYCEAGIFDGGQYMTVHYQRQLVRTKI